MWVAGGGAGEDGGGGAGGDGGGGGGRDGDGDGTECGHHGKDPHPGLRAGRRHPAYTATIPSVWLSCSTQS